MNERQTEAVGRCSGHTPPEDPPTAVRGRELTVADQPQTYHRRADVPVPRPSMAVAAASALAKRNWG